MGRKLIVILAAIVLAMSVVSVSIAEFDYSVFLENESFQARVDASVGAGNISYLEGQEQPIGKLTSDNNYFHFISFDILMLPMAPAVIRAQFAVAGTLVNAKELTLLTEKTSYTVKVDSNPSTSAYEYVTMIFSSGLFPMIEEIKENQIESIRFRLSGDFDIEGEMPVNPETFQTLYDLYKKAGGPEQDLLQVDGKYPVQTEQLEINSEE